MIPENRTATASPAAELVDDHIPREAAALVHSGAPPAPLESIASSSPAAPRPSVEVLAGRTAAVVAQGPPTLFTSSEHIDQLLAALATAQGAFESVLKDSDAHIESKRTGTSYSYEYASLAEVIRATRPHLSANGLALMQIPLSGQRSVRVITFLGHKSGQWLRTELALEMPASLTDPQELAKAVTYLRRIAQKAILDVADEDNDGESAGTAARDRADQARGPVPMPQRSTPSGPPPVAAPGPSSSSAGAAARPSDLRIVNHEWRDTRDTPPKRFLLVWLSDGRQVCTFRHSIAKAVISARERGLVFEDITTSKRGEWLYIEEMLPRSGGHE